MPKALYAMMFTDRPVWDSSSWMGIRMMAWPRGVLAEPIPTAMPRPSTSIWGKRSPFSYFSSLKTCSAMGRKTSRAAV